MTLSDHSEAILATLAPAILFFALLLHAISNRTQHSYTKPSQSPSAALHKSLKLKDQLVFTGSVMNLALTAYWMGQWPQSFYVWHSINIIVLVSIRWFVFRRDGHHYFLYDFCYWANLYSLVYVLLAPDNYKMFQVLFLVSNGPLAWSIPVFTNSAVFHNLQHMTSVSIHFSPMALSFCIRWTAEKFGLFAICKPGENCSDAESFEMIMSALTRLYLWWMVLYYVWVFIILDRRVKRKKYMTLFTWLAAMKTIGDLIKAVSPNEFVQKVTYVLGHYVFAMATMFLATVLWRNFYVHLGFILLMAAIAVWNGAGYYLQVFSNKYEKEVAEKVQKKLAAKRNENQVENVEISERMKDKNLLVDQMSSLAIQRKRNMIRRSSL